MAPVHAAEPLSPSVRSADRYPVSGYVPLIAHPLLPWTRRHVARVTTARYCGSQDDLWNEALTALLRAAVYYDEAAGAFDTDDLA